MDDDASRGDEWLSSTILARPPADGTRRDVCETRDAPRRRANDYD